MASFFSQFVLQVLGNILLLLGILAMLWTFDVRVGAVLSLFALAALAIMLLTRAFALPAWVAFREASARLFGFIEEHLTGLEDIRSLGAGSYVLSGLGERARVRMGTALRAGMLSSAAWSMPIVLSSIGIGLTYVLSAVLVGAGALTIGAAFTLYFYAGLLFLPLNRISGQLEEFQRASTGIVRIQQLRSARAPSSIHGRRARWPMARWQRASNTSISPTGQTSLPGPRGACGAWCCATCRSPSAGRRSAWSAAPGAARRRLLGCWCGCGSGGGRGAGWRLRRALRQPCGAASTRRAGQPATASVFRFGRDNLTLFDASTTDAQVLQALDELGLASWVSACLKAWARVSARAGGSCPPARRSCWRWAGVPA